MNQSAVVHRAVRTAAVLLMAVSFAGGLAATASAHRSTNPYQHLWVKVRVKAHRDWPMLTQAALYQVRGKPYVTQSVYLLGAIVGNKNTDVCLPAELVPTKFNALVVERLFDAEDAAYFSSQGMTDGSTMEVLRQGIVYGCKFFG
jgi:hypothetical protein